MNGKRIDSGSLWVGFHASSKSEIQPRVWDRIQGWISFRRLRRSKTTCLSFRKVKECRILLKTHRVFRRFKMSYVHDRLTNMRNCMYYKIINVRCKNLTITVWLGSPLRLLRSWYLIYYRNLTKILEVCLSMMMKLINFIFRNKVHLKAFHLKKSPSVSNIRQISVRWIKSGLCRILGRILSSKLR